MNWFPTFEQLLLDDRSREDFFEPVFGFRIKVCRWCELEGECGWL